MRLFRGQFKRLVNPVYTTLDIPLPNLLFCLSYPLNLECRIIRQYPMLLRDVIPGLHGQPQGFHRQLEIQCFRGE